MHEFEQISEIKKLAQRHRIKNRRAGRDDVIVDIGDDAAVLRWNHPQLVVTTDSQVEGVHFSHDWIRPDELGFRLLAVNVSDLAAMGATPKAAVVSLCLGPAIDSEFVRHFYKGLLAMARSCDVDIVGGNFSRSKTTSVFDLTAFGFLKGKPLTRSGARPGDLIAVTGNLGDSAAGLFALQKLGAQARKIYPTQVRRHLRPVPQGHFGEAARGVMTSCIDVSDGLSSELNHLAESSGLTFWVQEKKLPSSRVLKNLGEKYGQDPLKWVLHGGEEYQLLFTVSPRNWKKVEQAAEKAKTPVSVIGFTMLRKPKAGRAALGSSEGFAPVRLLRPSGETLDLVPGGWVH